MKYLIKLSPEAEAHLSLWIKSGNKPVLQKLDKLFHELEIHPTYGTGKPELLKGDFQGYWSRRITKADRLIYKILTDTIVVSIVSLKGHYNDK